MPNPNTLSWTHYQDIQVDDIELRQQFENLMKAGQYSQALTLLSTYGDELNGKAYVADTINKIATGILDLESRYNTSVTIYLSNLSLVYSNLINNFRKRGNWISSQQYAPYNFVVYNQELYMCFQAPPIGTEPTNTSYWVMFNIRGASGEPGVNVNMKYDWVSTSTYSPNDLVVYNTNIWVALKSNTGVTPGSTGSEDTWLLFLKVEPGRIYVGITPPELPGNNAVWFQTPVDPLTQTSTDPIIGQFKRYVETEGIWEEMYPNTLFGWIDNTDVYFPMLFYTELTIPSTAWANDEYTYTYSLLAENSSVKILPNTSMSEEQYEQYSELGISINGQNIVLNLPTKKFQNVLDIPIRIVIQ